MFDGATLGTATAAVSYPDPLAAYGYQCNATAPGSLPGRPYAVDQPFGAGHATILGSNSFFRGWTAGAQRLVMNGVMYPTAGLIARRSASGDSAGVLAPAGRPLTRAQLKRHKVRTRPVIQSRNRFVDATVVVRSSQAGALRTVVRRAKLPGAVAKRVAFTRHGRYVKLTIRGAAGFARDFRGDPKLDQLWTYGDLEMRPEWAWRIIRGMTRRHIKPIAHRI